MATDAVETFLTQLSESLDSCGFPVGGDHGTHFLLGVSGGIDSVVLSHAFARLGVLFSIAHYDHQLRASSAEDERFVRKLADTLAVPYYSEVAQPFVGQCNVEQWAREGRYAFLESLRCRLGADVIVTAHHQSDQAETLLMKLFAGRADASLQAMPQYCPNRFLLRPLLNVSKQMILDFAKACDLEFVQDESNFDTSRTRNWIRREIVPRVVGALNPKLESSLSNLADYLRQDEEYLEQQAEMIAGEFASPVLQSEVCKLHPAMAWRVLRCLAVVQCSERARKVSRRAYRRLLSFLKENSEKARTVQLGFGIFADLSQGKVVFNFESEDALDTEVMCPGSVRFCDYRIEAQLLEAEGDHSVSRVKAEGVVFVERFDAERVVLDRLIVRSRRPGDSMILADRGPRKLKKMFQEQGLMLTLRNRVPIVESDDVILWVPGVARSDLAPVCAETTTLLELTCYKDI